MTHSPNLSRKAAPEPYQAAANAVLADYELMGLDLAQVTEDKQTLQQLVMDVIAETGLPAGFHAHRLGTLAIGQALIRE